MSRRDVLVVTTPSVEGAEIIRYLKPVSAHLVAGTNIFKDILGSFSDIFGGRSKTYQKELASMYNDAVEAIKSSAFEIGANCILGLRIDIDEVSGGGKSMFMITAVGTAAILKADNQKMLGEGRLSEKRDVLSIEKLIVLSKRRTVIDQAARGSLEINDRLWEFITRYQVAEVLPFLFTALQKLISSAQPGFDNSGKFLEMLTRFIDALPSEIKAEQLFDTIQESGDDKLILQVCNIIKQLNLLDLRRCRRLLEDSDFHMQKYGVRIATYNKPFYDREDLEGLISIRKLIEGKFKERGVRSMKRQMLSSKEKEVWNCECGKDGNEIGLPCENCTKDILGFTSNEVKPSEALAYIDRRIEILRENLA